MRNLVIASSILPRTLAPQLPRLLGVSTLITYLQKYVIQLLICKTIRITL
jgi:hypothetical protein